jgi:hypothetical protein
VPISCFEENHDHQKGGTSTFLEKSIVSSSSKREEREVDGGSY